MNVYSSFVSNCFLETLQMSFNMETEYNTTQQLKVEHYPATHKEQPTDIFNNMDESEI